MSGPVQDRPSAGPLEVVPTMNSVRGLACLMVVALHVVGFDAASGFHLPMTSGWHYAMTSLEFLRMPLFTALSGYLYAGNRVTKPAFRRFWSGKFRRLALPLLCGTCVIWLLRRAAYHEDTPFLDAVVFSHEHLWYLQALLLIFGLISVWDMFYRPSARSLLLAGLVAIMVGRTISLVPLYSIGGAIYLVPYFLFGIILRERPEWLRDRRVGAVALGIIVIVLTTQQFGLLGWAPEMSELELPAAVAGMAGVVFFLQRVPQNVLLAAVGRYSYCSYLWHVIAAAAVRAVLLKIGLTGIPVMFLISLPISIVAPIILYKLVRPIPLLSEAFTGEKVRRRYPDVQPLVPVEATL